MLLQINIIRSSDLFCPFTLVVHFVSESAIVGCDNDDSEWV